MKNMLENTWIYGSKIAHKGLHNEKYPENSIGAIQNAIDHGYPFEIDGDDFSFLLTHKGQIYRHKTSIQTESSAK